MGVMAGAIVNARLDRVIGDKRIKKLLEDVESGKVEKLRQACLYIDMDDGKVVLPEDRMNEETAGFSIRCLRANSGQRSWGTSRGSLGG